MAHPVIHEQVELAPHTTLGVGGPARLFLECSSDDDIRETICCARDRRLPLLILGGGSNVVVADEGFPGVVLHLISRGIEFEPRGDRCLVRAMGGESWDALVDACVQRELGGLECLSGIPGTTGATPVQNVGAYGQEVADTITAVHAINMQTLNPVVFSAAECGFRYRSSRFKNADAGGYVLTAVEFVLPVTRLADIRYPELARTIARDAVQETERAKPPTLSTTRETVLRLRRSKGMILDPLDPDSRSAGSFFTNPVVDRAGLVALQTRWLDTGNRSAVPSFPFGDGAKIPAAWLVEQAGFPKGTRRGGVGVSSKHALALVNYNGSARELLSLAGEIRARVSAVFGIDLAMEPVLVPGSLQEQRND